MALAAGPPTGVAMPTKITPGTSMIGRSGAAAS